jgi:hypothetical protein
MELLVDPSFISNGNARLRQTIVEIYKVRVSLMEEIESVIEVVRVCN